MIRYHLDQQVAAAIARGLKRRGVDVTTTAEAGLQDADDEAHVAFALREGRVIFTKDKDFTRIHSRGDAHAGIVYSRQGSRSIVEIIDFLELMSQCLEPEEMARQLEYF